ncbi:hypothetical protein LCGC14_0439480 [marine sediment metagenome]|uniref:SF3 helicase domain-containing protein n=1 Tax=marine sediment metagenome TaxID=412755 RepID=A0A0F9SKZ4_9ZZZZ
MISKEEAQYQACKGLLDNDRNMAYKNDFYGLAKGKEEYIERLKEDLDWFDGLIENETRIEKDTLREDVLSLLHKKDFGSASEILVRRIEKNNYIYTTKVDKASETWIYSNGVYVPNGESEIRIQIRNIMTDNYNDWIFNQVMTKIRTDTFIESNEFFKDSFTFEIPVLNGLLDLKSLELLPFDPKKIFFTKLPVDYVEGETCELIQKFLEDVLSSPEDIDVFYELAGFGLIKDYIFEKAFMFVGGGRNGKGKSIELLKRLVGSLNCSSVPLSALNCDSPFVSKLFGRLFNLAGDISSKDLKDTGMFKQLTGRDLISANRKYKEVIEFKNYAKMVFACNELPRVYDYSEGFWERWVLLEFPYRFVPKNVYEDAKEDKEFMKIEDPYIIEQITTPKEMSGFLNMALLGLHRLFKNKIFSQTKGTEEIKNTWIRKADSFMAFCMDSIKEDYESRISKKEMRMKYKSYCRKYKSRGVSDMAIKVTLQEMFGVSEEYSSLGIGHQEWWWTGIKWK